MKFNFGFIAVAVMAIALVVCSVSAFIATPIVTVKPIPVIPVVTPIITF